MSELSVIRLKPLSYIHVLDNNTNVTRVEVGPKTYTRQDHEKVVAGPESMTIIPPRHFAVIMNPIQRNADGTPAYDSYGNVRLRHGDEEIRTDSEPFPLYPGEKLVGKVTPLKIIAPNSALRLRALRDFEDTDANGKAIKRRAGDEWLHAGPGTYKPKVEVAVAEEIKSTIIKPNSALKLRARKAAVDYKGVERRAGEEWLVRESGAYLPGVDEEIVEAINAVTLTDKKALHLRALRTFTDQFKVRRKAGEEWLVTNEDTEAYIPDVYEELVGEVKLTTLSNRQFCVVVDPVIKGTQRFGQREVRKGEISFFLRPGEKLENGIQNIHVLAAEEALLLRAKEEFVDRSEGEQPIKHQPGDRWMISGPREYIPPAEVEILERRKIIPLDQNEGIYVRDIRTGKVRAVLGSSYLLKPTEELWQKELSPIVEQLLAKESSSAAPRDKTRVITLRAPHNSAVQIYDYKEKKSRVRFGPDLVHLGPDEQFSVLSLSGDKPKRPHVIKTLLLMLGPDFMTDIITVETSDHARLSLKLSYNWHFDIEKTEGNEAATKLFQVPDFVGDACKAIASQVRTAVAAVPFDSFHKNSAKIIRTAVFGLDENQKVKRSYVFPANNLVITNIDIQSVEPVDQRTRDSLQKSVQLAIDITTKSQEATAKHKAEMLEQESRGRLEKQKIQDEADSEKARTMLLGLQAECAAVEAAGNATAEAKSRATASQIEGESNVRQAKLRTEALQVRAEAELEMTKARQNHELDHTKSINDLEISKASSLADIESQKFNDIVKAIGPKTIQAIAQAGPEMQAKLLQGLGLKSLLVTDGNSPINLFNTAQGLISPGGAGKGNKASDSY